MPALALALMVFFLALAFGVRVGVALRTTGSTGISSLRAAPRAELLGGGMFALATALGAANPALALADVIGVWDALDTTPAHFSGTILCVAGILGTFVAQMAMGSSWRIGVDPSERTELVTGGIFASMRNPIYTFMIVAWVGFALLVPTWVALAAGVLLVSGIQIQVRAVEEPFMTQVHGETYLAWARRVGRFIPGVGRLR